MKADLETAKAKAGSASTPMFEQSFKWSGTYYYENGESIMFSGNIKQQGDNIFGILSEPKTSFGPDQPYLESSIIGTIRNNQVNLMKFYTYDENHTVVYSGTFYPDEKAIRGTRKISETTGRFEISIIETP